MKYNRMATKKFKKIIKVGGWSFSDFFKKKETVVAPPPAKKPVTLAEQNNPNSTLYTGKKSQEYIKKISNVSDKIDSVKNIEEKIEEKGKLITSKLPTLASITNPIGTAVSHISEIIKMHPIGHLLVGTLLFVKQLKDLYKSHQQIQYFLAQVETIVESSYRLNELIDKINEMMVIYTFNNKDYTTNYDELFAIEKKILNPYDDTELNESISIEYSLFNQMLDVAQQNKNTYRSRLNGIDFDNLSKFIEPNKLVKEQLTMKIAEINKYLLSIATNSMLETLKADIAINKSGFIQLVLDEIKSRQKRFKIFKLYNDKKRDWDRINNMEGIKRKLNDDLVIMNSLFILVKVQMDFTIEYYKNQNISSEEWNKLWKLITACREYTSYMIPNEVFLTIKELFAQLNDKDFDAKQLMRLFGKVVNEIDNQEMIEMQNIDKENISVENQADYSDKDYVYLDENGKEISYQDADIGVSGASVSEASIGEASISEASIGEASIGETKLGGFQRRNATRRSKRKRSNSSGSKQSIKKQSIKKQSIKK